MECQCQVEKRWNTFTVVGVNLKGIGGDLGPLDCFFNGLLEAEMIHVYDRRYLVGEFNCIALDRLLVNTS